MTKLSKEPGLNHILVRNKIYVIRKKMVMLDSDLGQLYQVETKRINEQVGRNLDRFPGDFMFKLTQREWKNLKSQIATSSWGGRRFTPYAFTEHGILMLSSVLKSKRASQVNITIMRTYTQMRDIIMSNKDVLMKMTQLEAKITSHDQKIAMLFSYLKEFEDRRSREKRTPVGFKASKGDQH